MKITLTNKKTKEHKSLFDVEYVRIEDGMTKLKIEYEDQQRTYRSDEWDMVSYGEEIICAHCGKKASWDDDTGEIYNGEFICAECYQVYYGFCDVCGKLHKYTDMDEVVCEDCQDDS